MERTYSSQPASARDIERKLLETARRKGVKPYRLAQECIDECLRRDEEHRTSFWRGILYRMMEDEFTVTIPNTRRRGD